MTITEALRAYTKKLAEADVPSANLDCLILLEDLTGQDRGWLLAHPEVELSAAQLRKLRRHVERRAKHEPLAYIRGFTEFYGRRFKVNKRVLEPRPESETMIEMLKALRLSHPVIADVGTGSGALGITAALEVKDSSVDLYDIDSSALAVARHNAIMHELHLNLRKRNLLNRAIRRYDVVLANLPYIPSSWKMHRSVLMEPRLALDGGKDGLILYKKLFEQVSGMHSKPKYVLTESMPPQQDKLAALASQNGYQEVSRADFIQVFTVA